MGIKRLYPPPPTRATMTTLQSLLAAIITNPDDDVPRLMYADELQESGDRLDMALSQYIKLSIELANHKKLVKPRVDVAAKDISLPNDGYHGVDSYWWYQRGIELKNCQTKLWNTLIENNWMMYLWQSVYDWKDERGFIRSISLTATQFLSIKDQLIWHESMKDKCPKCKGSAIDWTHINRIYIDGRRVYKCDACNSEGEVPRPCPLTAHPVREIEITDYHRGNGATPTIREWRDELAPKYKIEFTIV